MNQEDRLKQGLQEMQIHLDEEKKQKLLLYLQEFHKWNKVYNLSAVRDQNSMVSRHLLDSLALLPLLEKAQSQRTDPLRMIDVGTGGGLPGIPLAISFPNIHMSLLDSNGKKTRFLFQTALKLGLKNVHVENNRVENFSPEHKFDIVTSRAFASVLNMVEGSRHLLRSEGEFWSMKGQYPSAELAECQAKCQSTIELVESHKLSIPGGEGERHLLILTAK